jgi:hypothetical protein
MTGPNPKGWTREMTNALLGRKELDANRKSM